MYSEPRKDLNFFQNYANHVKALDKKFGCEMKYLRGDRTALQEFSFFITGHEPSALDIFLSHINVLDPLRDGYDYMDNVMGSCVLPCLGMADCLFFTAKAITKLSLSVTETFYGNAQVNANMKARYQDAAALSCRWAMCILASSFLIFANSLVGLITRPAMTLAQGWNKSNEPRFKDELSKENSMRKQVITALRPDKKADREFWDSQISLILAKNEIA